jgi:EAL domain-containing protein (putative c-di-GMP-specific phosphodiesterase class I)
VRHFEILTRMLDRGGGIVMPGSFIPAAERYQLMAALDLHILRTLLRFLGALPPDIVRPDRAAFAVNLSGSSLGSPGLLESVLGEIRGSAIPPACLTFEITETAAIANLEESVRWMKGLKELGCRFSLDDFGSGLSSFTYLKNLKVDYLKIDGAFVRDIASNAIDCSMVEAIHRIGHQMGLKTVAEYVESDQTLALLRQIGVDYVQGNSVHCPEPLEKLCGA